MTNSIPISAQCPLDRFERLQTWIGADRESEWFTIPATGIGVELDGVELRAVPDAVRAVARNGEVRIRAVFRVESTEARVKIESMLADGGALTLRDAFGMERLQVLPGSSRLHADLTAGRYSVDATLTQSSQFDLALHDRENAVVGRRAQVG